MISRSDAELILSCALSTGGDFAEIFAENVNSGGIALLDSRVEGANRARSCGVGIRIFRETETVYAYTNDLTLEGMLETARTAAAALGCLAYYILYFFKSFAYDGLLIGGLPAATAAAALLLKIPASIFNGTVAIVLAPPLCLALRKALQQTNIQLP